MTYVDASPVIEKVAWTFLGHFFGFGVIARLVFKLSQRDRRIAGQRDPQSPGSRFESVAVQVP